MNINENIRNKRCTYNITQVLAANLSRLQKMLPNES